MVGHDGRLRTGDEADEAQTENTQRFALSRNMGQANRALGCGVVEFVGRHIGGVRPEAGSDLLRFGARALYP